MFIIKEGTTGGEGTDPQLEAEILKWLGVKGMIVRTKDQDATHIQTAIADATANRNIFAAIKEATGIDREANEEEGVYLKRATGKKLEEITTLTTKLKEYETKGVEGSALATEYKQQLEVMKKTVTDLQAKYETDTKNLNKLIFDTKVDADITAYVGSLPIRKMHDDEATNKTLQERLRSSTIAQFKSEYTPVEQDGKIVFKDKSGHIARKTTDGQTQAVADLLTPYFDPLIDKEHKATGTGSGNPAGGGNSNPAPGKKDWSTINRPKEVASQTQLYKWLQTDQKIEPNTKDFDTAFAHFNKGEDGKPLPSTPKAA